ncbi:MAG: hypothetical protein U1E23_02245 [Reyranellaceae bacterium]
MITSDGARQPAEPEVRLDGRRRRSEQTRRAIIEAYLDLLSRGSGMPTANQIAEAAGYSVRSIFERFSDLNALSLATADHAIVLGQTEAAARDVDADRATRIASHTGTRALACEKWLPLWRMITQPGQLPELATRVRMVRLGNLERIKLMYAPELATLDEAARHETALALAILTSFESWDQLRHCHGLSLEAAQAVWRRAVDRLLPPAG